MARQSRTHGECVVVCSSLTGLSTEKGNTLVRYTHFLIYASNLLQIIHKMYYHRDAFSRTTSTLRDIVDL